MFKTHANFVAINSGLIVDEYFFNISGIRVFLIVRKM